MRTRILTTAIVTFVVLAAASPAFAGEDGEKANLDIFAQVNLPTILTSLGVFVVLLIILSKTAWKPILEPALSSLPCGPIKYLANIVMSLS